jgi:predicted dithiol-disulfide oxidoreductase (DUF899 family)
MSTEATATDVALRPIVSHDTWLEARKAFMAKEKEFTRLRDQLSKERRELPWERVDKDYTFDGPDGPRTLAQLFGDSSQLVVVHFMFAPEWEAGCKSCSFWADNYNLIAPHLRARDIGFVVTSRAPVEKLEAYKRRLGWGFPWYSTGRNDFSFDYRVSFTPEELASHRATYNYEPIEIDEDDTDFPGISVFVKGDDGAIYHSYSTYSRGIDIVNGAYNFIDLTPKGRQDNAMMTWLRRHDEYGN